MLARMLIYLYEEQKLLHSKTQKTLKLNKSFFRNGIMSVLGLKLGYAVKHVPEPSRSNMDTVFTTQYTSRFRTKDKYQGIWKKVCYIVK